MSRMISAQLVISISNLLVLIREFLLEGMFKLIIKIEGVALRPPSDRYKRVERCRHSCSWVRPRGDPHSANSLSAAPAILPPHTSAPGWVPASSLPRRHRCTDCRLRFRAKVLPHASVWYPVFNRLAARRSGCGCALRIGMKDPVLSRSCGRGPDAANDARPPDHHLRERAFLPTQHVLAIINITAAAAIAILLPQSSGRRSRTPS